MTAKIFAQFKPIGMISSLMLASYLLAGCSSNTEYQYTLYRTGIDVLAKEHDETLRIHVATFDAKFSDDSEVNRKYNLGNCEFAKVLFETDQPHYKGSDLSSIKVKYWCEIGRFK